MNRVYKKSIFTLVLVLGLFGFIQHSFASTAFVDVNSTPSVTSTTASFAVTYDANNDSIDSLYVNYGTDSSMSSRTSTSAPAIKAGVLNFSATNLSPSTTYYFQAVGEISFLVNGVQSSGFATSSIYTFTTSPVTVNNCVITNFSPSTNNINSGTPVYIYWNTTNCTNATLSPLGYSALNSTGYVVSPYNTTTYTLNASNSTTSDSQQFTVNVNNSNTNYNCTIDSFRSNLYNVNSGSPAYLSWNTSNCSYVNLSPIGYSATYESHYAVYPSYPSTTYRLTGSNGTTSSLTIYVNNNGGGGCVGCNPNPNPNPNNSKINVTTTNVSSVSSSSSILHGTANSNGLALSVWFEYGTTPALGYTTSVEQGGSSTNANGYLGGLSPNTTYYYRFVARNSSDIVYGNIMSFATYPRNVVINNTTGGNVTNRTNNVTNNTTNNTTDTTDNNAGGEVNSYNDPNNPDANLSASAGSTGFSIFPKTFLGWLVVILVILASIIIIKKVAETKYHDRGI